MIKRHLCLLLVYISIGTPLRWGIATGTNNPDSWKEKHLKPPHFKKVGHLGKIAIWVVDGMYIRRNLDAEFTNFGHHYSFNCISSNEFWLDREAVEDERKFFIDHMLVEYRLMEKGLSYDSALEAADRMERAERKKAGDWKKMLKDDHTLDTAKVHVHLWKKLSSGENVWIVNGRLVRSVFDVDFTEGGHDRIYKYVPRNEVWIDNDLEEGERPFVLLHELHERNLMGKGWEYDRAHEQSSHVEYYYRHHPESLSKALEDEGWK